MRALKFAFLASLSIVTPALAADLSPQPTEPVAYSWTGAYVGAEAGYVWGSSTYDGAGSPAGPPYISTSLKPKGAFGGAYVGYNYQFDGNYVIGVEADANFANAKASNSFSGAPVFASSDLKWFGSARLRAGYAFDRFLPFVTGGLAIGRYSAATSFLPFPGAPTETSDTMVGWTVGAGLEYAMTDKLIARVEYRYSDYGRKSQSAPFIFPSQPARIDLTTNDVRVGLSYKF